MKEKLLFLLFIIIISGCSSLEKTQRNSFYQNELYNLNFKSELKKIILTWEVKSLEDLDKIEIYLKKDGGKDYSKIAVLPKDAREYSIETIPLLNYRFKIILFNKSGERTRDFEIKAFSNMENLILDKYKKCELQILLPKNYQKLNKEYPVVYMLDGKNMFSEYCSSNGEWKIDENMEKLLNKNKIDEIIVVGIDDRFPEIRELIDYVDSKYRTIKDRKSRAMMGSSGGASSSLVMTILNSDLISMAGAISLPQFKGIYDFLEKQEKKDIKIWIDGGTKENERGFYPDGLRNVLEILERKGYKLGEDLLLFEAKGKRHNEKAWSERIAYPYIFFAGKTKKKIKNIELESYVLNSYGKYVQINPVIEWDNDLKYSLYDLAKYRTLEKTKAQISKEGKLYFNGEKSLKIEVEYKGIKKEATLYSSEFLEEFLEGKKIFLSAKFLGKKTDRGIKIRDLDIRIINGINLISINSTYMILEKFKKEDRKNLSFDIENNQINVDGEVLRLGEFKESFIKNGEEYYYPMIFLEKIIEGSRIFHNQSDDWYILKEKDFIKKAKSEYYSKWWYAMKPAPILSEKLKQFNYYYLIEILNNNGFNISINDDILSEISKSKNSMEYYKIINEILEKNGEDTFILYYGSHFLEEDEIFNLIYKKDSDYRLKTNGKKIISIDGILCNDENISKIKEIYTRYSKQANIERWQHNNGEYPELICEDEGKNRSKINFETEKLRRNVYGERSYFILADNSVLIIKNEDKAK